MIPSCGWCFVLSLKTGSVSLLGKLISKIYFLKHQSYSTQSCSLNLPQQYFILIYTSIISYFKCNQDTYLFVPYLFMSLFFLLTCCSCSLFLTVLQWKYYFITKITNLILSFGLLAGRSGLGTPSFFFFFLEGKLDYRYFKF